MSRFCLSATPTPSRFPRRCYVPFRTKLPHLFPPNLTIWRNATILLLSRRLSRYSSMAIDRIKADLRTVYPSMPTEPQPVHLHTRTWTRSSYRHTTLAVLLDPAVRGFREPSPNFTAPTFLRTSTRRRLIAFLVRGSYFPHGRTEYHQLSDGRRMATPAAELAWMVLATSSVMYSAVTPNHASTSGRRRPKAGRPPILLSGASEDAS